MLLRHFVVHPKELLGKLTLLSVTALGTFKLAVLSGDLTRCEHDQAKYNDNVE